MKLKDLFVGISFEYTVYGNSHIDIGVANLCTNSKEVVDGSCFFAIVGTVHNGHQFIDLAIQNGASVIVCEKLPEIIGEKITYILVEDSSVALGYMASNFYNNPSSKLKVIGVTGTNGKTTTATLLYKLLNSFHKKTGLISTAGNYFGGASENSEEAKNTTPDALTLNKLFVRMIDAGCEYAVMEVSSHSVVQRRIVGINFTGGVYTNLTHDHLDYHHTIENYANAKKNFFDSLPQSAFALSNYDDEYGRFMLSGTKAKVYSYGFMGTYDFCEILQIKLLGRFNEYNALAVYGVAHILGFEDINIKKILSELEAPRGRFELVYNDNGIKVIVDYAHTPDAVQNVLSTARDLIKDNEMPNEKGRLVCIIGCGGDRDATKRPVMATLAYSLSDILILTSDNPRSEDPNKILHDMKQGLPEVAEKKYFVIPDRHEAILYLPSIVQSGDIVMVLGKGHETYQEIAGIRHHFDDREEVQNAFSNFHNK